MSTERKVISGKNIPSRLPITITLSTILALDYWNAPGWLWGVLLTILGIVWIAAIVTMFNETTVDIFEAVVGEEKKRSRFMDKLIDAMGKNERPQEQKN